MIEQTFTVTVTAPDGHPCQTETGWWTDAVAEACHELGASAVSFEFPSSELVILTEDGKEVRVGDRVFCYYDGFWGVIERIEDTHQVANEQVDRRNQALWADVRCDDGRTRSYNGQRLATKDPR